MKFNSQYDFCYATCTYPVQHIIFNLKHFIVFIVQNTLSYRSGPTLSEVGRVESSTHRAPTLSKERKLYSGRGVCKNAMVYGDLPHWLKWLAQACFYITMISDTESQTR